MIQVMEFKSFSTQLVPNAFLIYINITMYKSEPVPVLGKRIITESEAKRAGYIHQTFASKLDALYNPNILHTFMDRSGDLLLPFNS